MSKLVFAILASLTLAACGGGGDSGPTPATPVVATYPVFQSIVNVLNSAGTRPFTISATINGTPASPVRRASSG